MGDEISVKSTEEDPVLLEVANETVSNVIDTAKIEVARINNQQQQTKNVVQQIKKEEATKKVSPTDGIKGLQSLLSEEDSMPPTPDPNEESSVPVDKTKQQQ